MTVRFRLRRKKDTQTKPNKKKELKKRREKKMRKICLKIGSLFCQRQSQECVFWFQTQDYFLSPLISSVGANPIKLFDPVGRHSELFDPFCALSKFRLTTLNMSVLGSKWT